MSRSLPTFALTLAALLACTSACAQGAAHSSSEPALGQPAGSVLSRGSVFEEKTGDEIFANICRGCHMADGDGAVGAGRYPSFARNNNLQPSGYPLFVVVNGLHGMPAFGEMLSDNQIAAVVNYVRSHFGNDFRDAVTAADVKAVR